MTSYKLKRSTIALHETPYTILLHFSFASHGVTALIMQISITKKPLNLTLSS